MKFSERIGKRIVKADIQLDAMDINLRNGLWNIIEVHIIAPLGRETSVCLKDSNFMTFFKTIWFSFYKEPLDQMDALSPNNINNLRARYFKWDYLDVYDFIDFIIQIKNPPFNCDKFVEDLNYMLKRELSGYRIINGILSPIINQNEIIEIEKALNNTSIEKYAGAHIHLSEALTKLADRKQPDYRNSIKEAICAVESICRVIAGDPKADFGKALKILKTKIQLHSALEQGFIKIYGFTSDANGIRHALLEESILEQEDAMFMLISCSAFVNYLIVKANKIES